MNAQWLLAWWNLIFLVPFALALLYLGVYTLSGWTFGETDMDADHDVDVDADADADVDHDVDVDADADADVDADADADADADHDVAAEHDADADNDAESEATSTGGASAIWAALSFLGVGKVPISIILMLLLLSWGAIGFGVNRVAMSNVAQAWMVAMYSLPLAAIGSLLITSGTSRAINRFMPLNVTTAKRRHELLGSTGRAVYQIDSKWGMVSVRDTDSGDLFDVPCRLERSTTTPINKDEAVKLVAYSAKEGMYYVLPVRATIVSSKDAAAI